MIKLVFQALTVLVALAGGMTVAAGADGNNGNGNGSDKSKTEKSEKSDKADKPDKSDTPSKADTSSKPAKEKTPSKPDAASVPVPEDMLPKTSVDAEIVLPEVMTEEALSLREVRSALARISNGRMLDINLGEVEGRLVYQVTVLEAGNIARHVLIDAKSGLEVGDPR